LASGWSNFACEVATPVERTIALFPISVDLAVEDLPRNRVDSHFGGLSSRTLTMSVSSTFTSA